MELFPSRTVAFELLGWSVHWYGLMYLAAFCIAMWMVPRIQRYRDLHLSRDEWTNIVTWAVLGVIVGGRMGFVFFYEPSYFLERPEKILAVWEGGMSSHGGFIGVTVALLFAFSRRSKTCSEVLSIADVVVIPVAIGFAIGRIGNFINMELYGTVMTGEWGWLIPGVPGLRHPWPLYASLMNAVIALICFWHLRFVRDVPGRTGALFLILYGIGRFLLEYLKEQEYALIDVGVLLLSRGQFLTVGILVIGVWLWRRKIVAS